jgi:choloylglycine hydrolase
MPTLNATRSLSKTLAATLLLTTTAVPVLACTDFLIKAKDGSKVEGRSMEWGADLKSHVRFHPRGEDRKSESPDQKTSLVWNAKYSFLGVDCNGMDIVVDGMNEKGLSMSGLWLPGTVYQTVQDPKAALEVVDVGAWILGNYATVDEVTKAIGNVQVWGRLMAEWGGIPTMHLALHDSSGRSVVIEFTDGHQKIFENPNGVLTNAPTFDWHTTNLRNYIRLSPFNSEPVKLNGTVLAPPGQGGGFLGIPGDWTPPSRFVHTTAMLAFATPPSQNLAAVNLAEHLLNAVDIPIGDARADKDHSDYTQWIVIKDLTNKILYYRSYDNLSLRSIDLKNLHASKQVNIPIAGGNAIVDSTTLMRP